jgi:hypothetical protein
MRRRIITLLIATAALLAACGSDSTPTTTASPTPNLATRPSTPVKIYLVSPTNGEVVHGDMVHVQVRIVGGVISTITSTHITPTLGHVHLYFDNQLIYMAFSLQENLPVHAGVTYTMYAEFVAQDHFPFYPRDVTPTIIFTVAPS